MERGTYYAVDGTLNGTTAVTIIAASGREFRRIVKSIIIQNRDTAAVTVTIRYLNGANTRQVWTGSIAVNDTLVWGANEGEWLLLDDTTKSITAVMSGAAATTNPDYIGYFEEIR